METSIQLREYLGVMLSLHEDGVHLLSRSEGYKRENSKYGDLIRVDVPAYRAPDLLHRLCTLFTGPVEVLLEHARGPQARRTIWHSPSMHIQKALDTLVPYHFPLFHDGSLAFGFGAPSELEVFVTEHKIFRIYSIFQDRVETVLREFGIQSEESLLFADEVGAYCLSNLTVLYDAYRKMKVSQHALSAIFPAIWRPHAVTRQLISQLKMSPMKNQYSKIDSRSLRDLEEMIELDLQLLMEDFDDSDESS